MRFAHRFPPKSACSVAAHVSSMGDATQVHFANKGGEAKGAGAAKGTAKKGEKGEKGTTKSKWSRKMSDDQ
eukprot:151938-Prorocentrum_minimum.AAC.6